LAENDKNTDLREVYVNQGLSSKAPLFMSSSLN